MLCQAEDSLKGRVTEIERLNRDLQVLNGDLEAFASSASHDLRTPLRRINSYAGLVLAKKENRLTTDSRRWLDTAIDETGRMDRLIHDLLFFARLGQAELDGHSLDMTQLVNDVIEEFRPAIAKGAT